jgi:acyl-coenzyme A synthetase/AMP-(fatty) acid ligase
VTAPDDGKAGTTRSSEAAPPLGPSALRGWLEGAARSHPNKPYLVAVEDGRALSYRQLREIAARVAGHLAARGIGASGRVVLLANNALEHVAAYVGVLASGATICTVHVEMNRGYFAEILPALRPRLVLHEEGLGVESLAATSAAPWRPLGRWAERGASGFFADIAAATAKPDGVADSAQSDAVIFFTSGTSARPKGVVLTYRELLPNAAATAAAFELGADDRIYDYRSFNWASAQILSALATLSVGATLLLGRRFSRSRFFADIARHTATVAAGNPTVLGMLLQGDDAATADVRGSDLRHLRYVTSSSAPLLLEDWKRFEARFGIPVVQGYGSSETGWIAGSSERTRRHGTVGKPLPYLCTSVTGREGQALPPGETGHVEVGGLGDNAYRYLGENGRILVNATGRIRTGDMGFLDADGYLHLTGREKDLIIRGGVNISPLEIDNVLLQIPGIAEAATVGVPDRIYGEEVAAFVVLKPGERLTADAILTHCAQRLSPFKAPKHIAFADALPKTERGKLDRKALAARWRS